MNPNIRPPAIGKLGSSTLVLKQVLEKENSELKSAIEQVLEAAPHKATLVRSPATYHEIYPS